jgi:TRAP-type C4-dicarboxylate transport system permease small subunit
MKKIASALLSLEKMLTRFNFAVAAVCGVVLFLFMLMVVGDVTGRYLFLSPIEGTLEVGENVLAFAVFLSWAAVEANNQHIRVLIGLDRLKPKVRVWFEIFVCVLGLAVIMPVAWYSFGFMAESIRIHETGLGGKVFLFPGKVGLFIGTSLFSLQFLVKLFRFLLSALTGQPIIYKGQVNA